MFDLSSGPQYLLLMGGVELRWKNKRRQMHANLPKFAASLNGETNLWVIRKSIKCNGIAGDLFLCL